MFEPRRARQVACRRPETNARTSHSLRIGNEVELLVFPGDPQPGNTPGIVFGLAEGGIDTVVASLAAAGVDIVTPVTEAPGGWSADFKDPDGHVISFFQSEALPRVCAEAR